MKTKLLLILSAVGIAAVASFATMSNATKKNKVHAASTTMVCFQNSSSAVSCLSSGDDCSSAIDCLQ